MVDVADNLLRQGREAFAGGRLEAAAASFREAMDAAPDLEAAHLDLGGVLIMLGRAEEAACHLQATVRRFPSSVEARVNLANAQHARGMLDTAEASYREALAIDPGHARGLLSLGNLLCTARRPAEALPCLEAAVAAAPRSAAPHQFLGNALRDLGRLDEAVASYQQAVCLDPAIPEANENLGHMLKAQQRYAEARERFRASGKPQARALALECELLLGEPGRFFEELEARRAEEATNLHSAALSAYVSSQLGRPDPHPFCPDPLSHVSLADRYTGGGVDGGGDADYLRDLVAEAREVNTIWEPRGVSTKGGFQTGGNLFAHGYPALARLEQDLLVALHGYCDQRTPRDIALVSRWPARPRLHGWFVRLLPGGHQDFHHHPFGWVSGCLYLQMPELAADGEGSIEFSVDGGKFPKLSDRPAPCHALRPRPGQLVLFPSSLYHRTIPFHSPEERLCIAFDMLPA